MKEVRRLNKWDAMWLGLAYAMLIVCKILGTVEWPWAYVILFPVFVILGLIAFVSVVISIVVLTSRDYSFRTGWAVMWNHIKAKHQNNQ